MSGKSKDATRTGFEEAKENTKMVVTRMNLQFMAIETWSDSYYIRNRFSAIYRKRGAGNAFPNLQLYLSYPTTEKSSKTSVGTSIPNLRNWLLLPISLSFL